MLSRERWKPQPVRWSLHQWPVGAGLAFAITPLIALVKGDASWSGPVPIPMGLGCLLLGAVYLFEVVIQKLRSLGSAVQEWEILRKIVRLIFHEGTPQDGRYTVELDMSLIRRIRGGKWTS
jgi:hypothetical protein